MTIKLHPTRLTVRTQRSDFESTRTDPPGLYRHRLICTGPAAQQPHHELRISRHTPTAQRAEHPTVQGDFLCSESIGSSERGACARSRAIKTPAVPASCPRRRAVGPGSEVCFTTLPPGRKSHDLVIRAIEPQRGPRT